MGSQTNFTKSYQQPSDNVRLLESRGLFVYDRRKAENYIKHIGYYRLSAYMYPLFDDPKERHIFKPWSSFMKILKLYRFDKKLRLLIFNEIEKIEVAFRCALTDIGCEETGDPFWITNPANFISKTKFNKTMYLIKDELRHSHEEFVVHFKAKYSDPFPPAWMLTEIMPLGVAYNVYSNIRSITIKKRISKSFGLLVKPFESWLTVLTLTRNACCHHSRVWNKQNTIRPMIPSNISLPWITLSTDPMRIYFDLCIIKFFLNIISPDNDMKDKLRQLLSQFSGIDLRVMGFPDDWESEPVWI